MESYKLKELQHEILRFLKETQKIQFQGVINEFLKMQQTFQETTYSIGELERRKYIKYMGTDNANYKDIAGNQYVIESAGVVAFDTNILMIEYENEKLAYSNIQASLDVAASVIETNKIQKKSTIYNGILAFISAIILTLQTCILYNQSQESKKSLPQNQVPQNQNPIPNLQNKK